MQKSNAERRFSADYEALSFDQKWEFLGERIPGYRELVQLIKWALQVDPLLEYGYSKWSLRRDWIWRDDGEVLGFRYDLTPFLTGVQKILVSHFLPLPTPHVLPPPHDAVVPECIESVLATLLELEIEVDAPTEQERAEASVGLKGWLMWHASATEIEALWSEIDSEL